MKPFEWYQEWRRNRARKLLRNEIERTTSDLTVKISTANNLAQEYRTKAEQEKARADSISQEYLAASEAYQQQVREISLREQQAEEARDLAIAEKDRVLEDTRRSNQNTRMCLEQLTQAHQAATLQIFLRTLPENVSELVLDKGLLESYKQLRRLADVLLESNECLTNQILVAEAENLEASEPRLVNWPIAIIRGGKVIYSTGKFQKRLGAIPRQNIAEQIMKEPSYARLKAGKEAEIQVESLWGRKYHLTLIPHLKKGQESPDAIFAYLSPPERHQRLAGYLGKKVREIGRRIYQGVEKRLSTLPKLPPSPADNYPPGR